MRELAAKALETAKLRGATYADVRILHETSEHLSTKNGQVAELARNTTAGFGVRVIAAGAWGFASSSKIDAEEVQRVAAEAVAIARASARAAAGEIRLAPERAYVTRWATPVQFDPFEVPVEEKIGLLLRIDGRLRAVKGIRVANGHMRFIRKEQLLATTEGSEIEQTIVQSGVGYSAVAANDQEIQVRSFPNSFRGQFETKGYELIHQWPLEAEATRVAEEAVALLSAPQCPAGKTDIILGSSQLGLQIHESCGHPIELDRVLGMELNFAGGSFLTPDKLGTFRYGSDLVHLTADATSPGGLGTFGFDDEGVPAQKWDIVKDGIFRGYLTSRETALRIGLARSQGTVRADGWNRLPMIRMNNVSMQPGTWELDALVADTKDGIYFDTNRSWSIDQLRYNFQFGTEAAWEIKSGKKGRLLKNATYQGITPEFWGACDAVCNRKHWTLWGTPNCGKGQPGQTMSTGHGAAPARFRNVAVGVGYKP